MTNHIDVAQLGPALADDLSHNGGEITLTREGKPVAKLVRVDESSTDAPPPANGRVLYKGEWMSAAGAERERALEPLRGSITIHGDIISPIEDIEWDALK